MNLQTPDKPPLPKPKATALSTERTRLLSPTEGATDAYSPPHVATAFDFISNSTTESTPPLFSDGPRSLPVNGSRPFDYGTTLPPTAPPSSSTLHRHHSILRASSARTLVSHKSMRKSASVEFRLASEDESRRVDRTRRPSFGRDFPRRLTMEEKEDLYRVRPDLEIGPVPYFQEQIAEMKRQSQRRMLFAIFGGMFSMLLLMMVYYLLTKKYKKKMVGGLKHVHGFAWQWDA